MEEFDDALMFRMQFSVRHISTRPISVTFVISVTSVISVTL